MNRTRPTLTLALCALLAACGGGGGGEVTTSNLSSTDRTAPMATIDRDGPALDKTTEIKVTFSETMDPATLRLGGSLGEQAGIRWSQSAAPNDTLTLTPRGGRWSAGAGALTLAAADLAGNALAPLARDYVVRLDLQPFDAASVVIGQADFTSEVQAVTDHNFGNLYGNPGIAPDGRLFVADYGSDRVLGFPSLPDVNGAAANLVLGAPDFTHAGSGGNRRDALGGPQQVVFAGNRMIVSEYSNDRVVIYNSVPADSSALPDVVVGKPDFDSGGGSSCVAESLGAPETVSVTPDGKLIVSDFGHNRVLIWNAVPTQNGTAPDLVLGQADFTHCTQNDDDQDGTEDAVPSARTLNSPAGTWSDGRRLVVVDRDNNRVLVWTTFPTNNFAPADLVLGQPDMARSEPNDDDQDGVADAAPTARTLSRPYDGVHSNGVQLAIADTGNNRVLVWNTFPTRNFQPADLVLGQGTFQGQIGNDDGQTGTEGAPTARVLRAPRGVLFHGEKLIVVDAGNQRLLVFKTR